MKARDWNEQFQVIVRKIHQFEEGESLRMKKTLNDSLFQLIQVTFHPDQHLTIVKCYSVLFSSKKKNEHKGFQFSLKNVWENYYFGEAFTNKRTSIQTPRAELV